MEGADALARLAKASGLKLKKVGANSFVLTAAPSKAAASSPARKPKPPVITASQSVEPDPEPEPQDIVVTASKRDTLSQRFPGQWSRIDGDEFTPLGVPGTEAIEVRSVGFSSTHLGAGRNKLFIRGIADSSFSGPTQSPVGQYFGDMRTGYSGPDPDLKLVDMDAIESWRARRERSTGRARLAGSFSSSRTCRNRGAFRAWLRSGARQPGTGTWAMTRRGSSMLLSEAMLR